MITRIDTGKAFEMIDENKNNPGFHIIDIRTPGEFASGYIEGAVNIDFYSDNFEQEIKELDRNEKYLVYCHSGNRSGKSMKTFAKLKFREVYDMAGGMSKWISEKLPVKTDSYHAAVDASRINRLFIPGRL